LALERPAAAPVSDAAADRLRSRGPVGGPSDAAEVHLAAAAERLRAMSEMFEDRIRASTRALEVLADEVAADMRGSEDYLGQLSHSMTTVVERLGRRLESRLDGWSPAAAGTGSDLAILTQRLEAIVAALDEGALRP
jgi:hypothetical protein